MRNRVRGAVILTFALAIVAEEKVCAQGVAGSEVRPTVRVACVGDSITLGTGLKDRAVDAYPARLGKRLGAKWDVRNFGVDGASMIAKGTLPYEKQPAYQAALAFNPHVVILMLGTNDVAPQNWKFQDEFVADAQRLIAGFSALPGRPRIFIAFPPPIMEKEFSIKDHGVKQVQPLLTTVAEQSGARLIDLYTPLLGKPECFRDGVHPNAAGAEVIAASVYKALSTRPSATPSR